MKFGKTDILTDRKYAKRVTDKTKEYKERDRPG